MQKEIGLPERSEDKTRKLLQKSPKGLGFDLTAFPLFVMKKGQFNMSHLKGRKSKVIATLHPQMINT